MGSFEVKETFYLNNEPFKIISGAFHYFRTVPEYWTDRLEKLKAMGCNTVETYIPWNMHEPNRGEFCFEGMLDIESFIQKATNLGLYIILRPSPYICAEWEFGGLPGWLLKEDGMKLRVDYSPFLNAYYEYCKVLFPKLVPHQIDRGGNIILMQVENEYGYYANDKVYLEKLRDMMRELDVTVPLITSNNPTHEHQMGGSLEGALSTGNFGSKGIERFEVLKDYTNGGPLMCTEFWVGWFDYWGNGGHMRGNMEESTKELDDMLSIGHVNIYMFQGGTNFGFMNGSNYYDELQPDVTSYDYDALLTEDGQITEKYLRFQKVISKYAPIPEVKLSTKIERGAYGELICEEKVSLFSTLDTLSKPIKSNITQSMERLGQNYGYILYRSTLSNEANIESLRLYDANDRAQVFVDGKHVVTMYDKELLSEVKTDVEDCLNKELDILVENMGRVNFGPLMDKQRKGIDHCVQINGHMHNGWEIYTLLLDNVENIDFSREYADNTPAFYKFSFDVKDKKDTFLDMEGFGKGVAFINGFNLGRYWEIGPQKRLYIPAPLLKEGRNTIILFETEGKSTDKISLKDEPDLG